jgi:hypothetical protein
LKEVAYFFDPEKATVNVPALPRISPSTHHKNTTSNTTFSQKPPAKTPLHHTRKKYNKNHIHDSAFTAE